MQTSARPGKTAHGCTLPYAGFRTLRSARCYPGGVVLLLWDLEASGGPGLAGIGKGTNARDYSAH